MVLVNWGLSLTQIGLLISIEKFTCYLFELLSDQWLSLPAMYYRWLFPEQRGFLETEWGSMMAPEALPAERLSAARQSMKQFANAATGLGASEHTAVRILSLSLSLPSRPS